MFICIWKRMREMNDNLIATIVHTWALFISIWLQTTFTVLFNKHVHVYVDGMLNVEQEFCSGTFNDHEQMVNLQISPDKLTQMDNAIARNFNIGTLLYCISMIFLMVAIQIRRYKTMAVAHSPIHTIGVEKPKDLESMLLNFNLLILIVINEGCMSLWRRYEIIFYEIVTVSRFHFSLLSFFFQYAPQ
jgi:hypothetical protein